MTARKLTWTGALNLAVLLVACTPMAGSQSNAAAPASEPAFKAPAPIAMDSEKALGLWYSDFGAVKIERDDSGGAGGIMGIWVYDRGGEEVIGFFAGQLRGNVLEFTWNEPARPQELRGTGYLVFEPQGSEFSGRWWTDDRTRGGQWDGSRRKRDAGNPGSTGDSGQYGGTSYGGNSYGGKSYGGNRDVFAPAP